MPRTVVVTGGTTRLGSFIANRLRADGWRVLSTSHRPDAGADIVCDFSAPDAAERVLASVRSLNGGRLPDALVNNAALFAGDAAVLRAVNFETPSRLVDALAREASGESPVRVVNVLDARTREGAYGETKAALAEFTRVAAGRYAGRVAVNGVAPGPVLVPTAVREKAGACPFGRPTPDAVADAVAFLLSAAYTTGCVVTVDGGQAALEARGRS